MNELHDLLEQLAEDGPQRDPSEMFVAAQSRATRVRRRRRSVRVVAAVAASAVVAVVSVALVSDSATPKHHITTRGTQPPPVSRTPLDVIPLAASASPPLVAAAGGRLWIAEPGDSPAHGHLLEIDPVTGAVEHRITLAGDAPYAVAATADAVWVRSQQGEDYTKLEKIDTATHRVVATIPFAKDGGLAVANDDVWAIDGAGTLVEIDPATSAIRQRISMPGGAYPALTVSSGQQGVMLANSYDGSLLVVRGNTVSTIATLPPGRRNPFAIVQLDGAAWVAAGSTLTPVLADGSFGSPPLDVGTPITDVAGTGHTLWVATPRGILRIDTQNSQIQAIALPRGAHGATGVSVDPVSGDAFVVIGNPNRIARFAAAAPYGGGAIVAEPRQQPDLAVAVPGGCPLRAPTPPPAGEDVAAKVRAAAIDYARRDRFWAEISIDKVYRVDRGATAGTYGGIFASNVARCGATIAEQSYGVEMTNPLINQSSSGQSQVVVSHFAGGWRAWGYYH